MMKPPSIKDIEASGFGAGAYPIEVGYMTHHGKRRCSLITPLMIGNIRTQLPSSYIITLVMRCMHMEKALINECLLQTNRNYGPFWRPHEYYQNHIPIGPVSRLLRGLQFGWGLSYGCPFGRWF